MIISGHPTKNTKIKVELNKKKKYVMCMCMCKHKSMVCVQQAISWGRFCHCALVL